MLSSETARTVRTSIAGAGNSYTIGFSYFKNTNGEPQLKIQKDSLTSTALVWGTDYTLSSDGLSIVITADIGAGHSIYISRNIPKVQLSDYTVGRIDPEQIEKSFDLLTEIAQQDGLNEADCVSHLTNYSNPHQVTKTQLGLGNVDNTSDANKPISTATQTALDGKQATLTAGSNITIENNVISATGGGATYTAGNGLSLDNNEFSINTSVVATQTDLSSKQNTLQYSTMPTASASNLGNIVQYVGTTTSSYTEGYFYQCLASTTTTPALVTVSTSGTAGLGTVTCNADTYGNEVGHIPYECNFVFRGYPTVIVIRDEEESATTLTLTRDTESDTNDMYAWTISSDNSTVWSDTREAEANTMFYDLPQGGLCQYCPDEVTVSSRTTGLDGRWQQDLGDDYYDDATLSDYGISYDGVALVGARIETTYTPANNTGNTTYAWTQIDIQPASGTDGTTIHYNSDNKLEVLGIKNQTLVTSLSASSTDTQYPSAKCVYDIVGNIETTLNTIRGV